MGRRRKDNAKAKRDAFAGDGNFSMLTEEMRDSPAFNDLTKNQRILYIYLPVQRFRNKPRYVYKGIEQFQDDYLFFFSIGDAERFGLYKRNNDRAFRNDMKALIEHGFIKLVMNGKNQKVKSVYRLENEWKRWSPKTELDPENST